MFNSALLTHRLGPSYFSRNYSSQVKLSKSIKGSEKPVHLPSKFRPCVGAIIFNLQGKLLCGKRIDISYWQMPQGGMHPEEDPINAALREISEEIGLIPSQLKVIGLHRSPLEKFTYHQPVIKDGKQYCGQEQRYVLVHWNGQISDCNLDPGPEPPEFSEIDWLTWDELISRSVPSRTFIYARLRNTVKPIISEYLEKSEKEKLANENQDTKSGKVNPTSLMWGENLGGTKMGMNTRRGREPSPLINFMTSEIVSPSGRKIPTSLTIN